MSQQKFVYAAALALVLTYLFLGLLFLDQLPIVHEDEPWIASTGWSLAQRGVFGSSMFEGMDGMGERYYEFMPLYPLTQAVIFRGAGIGLFQARFVSVAAGALTLCLTFAVGRKLYNPAVGLAAMSILLFARVGVGTKYLPTGLIFLDINRLARYDALVPVMGLAALAVFLTARTRGKLYLYFIAGILAGLSALAHLYGVFWGAALLLLALTLAPNNRARPKGFRHNCQSDANAISAAIAHRAVNAAMPFIAKTLWVFSPGTVRVFSSGTVLLGLALPWSAYALYLLTGLEAWTAQLHWNAGRFDVLNGMWLVQNILTEPRRYALREIVTNPQLHFSALVIFGSCLLIASIFVWRAWRLRDAAAYILLVTTACLVGGLTLFVSSKVPNYLLTVLPLLALFCGWGIVALWKLGSRKHYGRVVRAAVVLLSTSMFFESAWHTAGIYANAATVTPYAQIVTALRGQLGADTRVVGLHSTWFAYADTNYRNVLALFDRARALQSSKNPVGRALTEFDPQVIVLDPRLKAYFDDAKIDPRPAQIHAWMRAQNFRCMWSVGESTQGYFQVFERARVAAPASAPDSVNEPCAIQITTFPVSAPPASPPISP